VSVLTVKLPDSVKEDEAQLMLAIKLYETGRLSCGQAAEVAGYSKRAFMELLENTGFGSSITHRPIFQTI